MTYRDVLLLIPLLIIGCETQELTPQAVSKSCPSIQLDVFGYGNHAYKFEYDTLGNCTAVCANCGWRMKFGEQIESASKPLAIRIRVQASAQQDTFVLTWGKDAVIEVDTAGFTR